MPAHLGHSALCQIITLLHVGLVITLIFACFRSCNNIGDVLENCVTFELKQHRYLMTGVSAVFLIVFSMTFTHAVHHSLFALSPFPMRSPFSPPWCTSSEACPSGTIACGVCLFWYWHHCHLCPLTYWRSWREWSMANVYSVCVIVSENAPIVVGHRSNHTLRRLWRPFLSGWDNSVS